MTRRSLVFFAVALISLTLASTSIAAANKSLVLTVYSDGYVGVSQTLQVDPKAPTAQVVLLSTTLTGLVATDQNGSPLSYTFSGGPNVTVYTVGASEVNLHYDTDGLTVKNGTVWTVVFDSKYNSTLILPEFSTIEQVSGTPYTVNQTNDSPEMTLAAGSWKVSYGVPIGSTTTMTTTNGGSSSTGTPLPSGFGGLTADQAIEIGGVMAVVVGAGLYYAWRRRSRLGPEANLRPDDVKVLGFIRERGGKVLEPEIRMKFALPKTSAWRQIKRLERLGYVQVTKIGSQNQIELLSEKKLEGIG